jgi:hypothetical protein
MYHRLPGGNIANSVGYERPLRMATFVVNYLMRSTNVAAKMRWRGLDAVGIVIIGHRLDPA